MGFLGKWLKRKSPSLRNRSGAVRPPQRLGLRVEALEGRVVLSGVSAEPGLGQHYQYLAMVPAERADRPAPQPSGSANQAMAVPSLVPVAGSFQGMSSDDTTCGCEPPDPGVASGPNNVVETVNTAIRMYTKTGTILSTQEFASFFAPLGGTLTFSDPVVAYDDQGGHWIVGILDYNTSSNLSRFDIAVSTTSDPTGSWEMHRINVLESNSSFADYPRLGWNHDAIVVSFNMFPHLTNFKNVQVVAIDKASAEDGNPSTFTYFRSDVPGGVAHFTLTPAAMHGSAAGGPMYLVEALGNNQMGVMKMTNLLTSTPSYNETAINVSAYTQPPKATQPGGTIDTIDTRVFESDWRSNRLVAAHTIGLSGDSAAHAQWFDFSTAAATPTLNQQGSLNPGTGISTFFPTIASDANGDLGMDYMESSASEYWSIYSTGQAAGDPAGTMQPPTLIKAGEATYTGSRAGDFSEITVDPADGRSFWLASEYKPASHFWGTWVAQFQVGIGGFAQIVDPGFETPHLGTGPSAYQYTPSGSPWTFSGPAGVAGNGSAFTSGNPPAPQGTQVAFLQVSGSSISQAVNFAAGTYTLSFDAAQRGNYQASSQTLQVQVDGVVVSTLTPAGTSYSLLTTSSFTVAAGVHILQFLGLNPNGGDNTAFIDSAAVNFVASIGDPGFETPHLGTGPSAYQYTPSGSPWTFSGPAGVAGNGSAFTSGNPPAPQGTQVAFLQVSGSSISQAVNFAAGTYTLSFDAAQRGNYQASSQTLQVQVDGVVVSTFTPAGTSYSALTTSSFTIAAGAHTLRFLGLNPNGGDNTAFIDQVDVNLVASAGGPGFAMPHLGTGSPGYEDKPSRTIWRFSGSAGVTTGMYTLGFDAAQRANYQASSQTFHVLIDGVGTFPPAATSYSALTTISFAFAVAPGAHTITFSVPNANGGDNTAFTDPVFVDLLYEQEALITQRSG